MPFDLMIVDDSPVMRHFILRSIHMSGFDLGRTLQAEDGVDALAQLDRMAQEEQRGVDAVLTDINMPRMDGEQLVKHIRERGWMKTVPVLVISTDATSTRVERLLTIGAQGYVAKPFSPERLLRELERVLPAAAKHDLRGETDDECDF